jgi:predicted dehydrogenase
VSGDVIGVGIIGLSAGGGWAAQSHVPAIAATPELKLRGVCASRAESTAAAARRYGVVAAASPGALAARDDVDLVVVAVNAPHHADLVGTVLATGTPVLCEWPLGASLAQTRSLASAAQMAQVPAFVGLQARAAPAVRYLRDLVSDGFVGQVLSTSVIASGRAWGESFKSRQAYTMDPNAGSSMLTIPVGHTLDVMAMVLGELSDVCAVVASARSHSREQETGRLVDMTVADQVVVAGRLPSGGVASVHFRGGVAGRTNFYWEILGARGELIVEADTGHLQIADLRISGGRGAPADIVAMPVPAHYHRVAALDGRTGDPAYNVAHAYQDVVASLRGAGCAPDFAHAVHRKSTLAAIAAAAVTRAPLTDRLRN